MSLFWGHKAVRVPAGIFAGIMAGNIALALTPNQSEAGSTAMPLREVVHYNLDAAKTVIDGALRTLRTSELSPESRAQAVEREIIRFRSELQIANWGPYGALKPLAERRLATLETHLIRGDLRAAATFLSGQRRWIATLEELSR